MNQHPLVQSRANLEQIWKKIIYAQDLNPYLYEKLLPGYEKLMKKQRELERKAGGELGFPWLVIGIVAGISALGGLVVWEQRQRTIKYGTYIDCVMSYTELFQQEGLSAKESADRAEEICKRGVEREPSQWENVIKWGVIGFGVMAAYNLLRK